MTTPIDRRAWLARGAWLTAGAALGYLGARSAGWPALADEASPGHEARFKKLKLKLPEVKGQPSLIFVPTVRVGDMLYVSGHIAQKDGKPIVGKLGKDMKTAEGKEVARQVALFILAAVRAELGSFDKVVRLVKTLGMVNCTPDFTEQPEVVNGFSGLMVEVFGEKAGKGTRSSVGMVSLPRGTPVEVEAQFQIKV